MSKSKLVMIALWALAISTVAAYFVARAVASPRQAEPEQIASDDAMPPLFRMPAFALTDHNNKAFTSDDLDGKAWVGFIFLTNCPTGACPTMVGKMADLRDGLADVPVEFVSFSVDPDRDTPEVLAGYAQRVTGDAPGDRWHLLTGDTPEQMKTLAQQMKLAVGDDWGHSTQFLLVDGNGFVRGLYGNSDENAMDRLRADAARLVENTK